MAVTPDELRDLPPAEKLCLVEFLWDELGNSDVSIPLPDWVDREAARRRNEMVEDRRRASNTTKSGVGSSSAVSFLSNNHLANSPPQAHQPAR